MKRSISSLVLLIFLCACSTSKDTYQTTTSGLKYKIKQEGNGVDVQSGDRISIKESTRYRDGTLLFTTDQIGGQLTFQVGANQVIQGLDEGVRGMKAGEIRELIVPPHLCKRSVYPDYISPDSSLVYIVELLEVFE